MENNIEISKGKTFFNAISYVFVFLGLQIVLGLVLGFLINALGLEEHSVELLMSFGSLATILAAIYVIKMIKKENNIAFKSRLSLKNINYKFLLGSSLLTISLTVILDFVMIGLLKMEPQKAEPITASIYGVLMVIAIIIIAPIFEEIIFRFGVLEKLETKFNKISALIITSLVFTVVHFYGLTGFLQVFILAMVMGYFYSHTKNLVYVIFIHFVNNLFSTMQNISVTNNPNSFLAGFPHFGIELLIVFITLLLGCYLIYKEKDKVKFIKQ